MKKLLAFLERNLIPELPIKGTLGIPRATMPQIASGDQQDFLDQLRHKGIHISTVNMRASDIHPTQNEINSDKVDKWIIGKKPLVISSDNYVLDGHHQWAKAMLTDSMMKLACIKVNTPIRKLLDYARNYKRVGYKDFQDSVMHRLELLVNG